jgi:hypothetical protein
MVNELLVVELLGKNWFVDERLKEHREINNPHIHFSFREMDDLIEIGDFLKHPITFGASPEDQQNRIVVDKLGRLFDKATNGDREALEEIEECMP